MNDFNKRSLLSLFLLSTALSPAYSSNPQKEEVDEETVVTSPIIITSAIELKKHGEDLFALAERGNHHETIRFAERNPTISIDPIILSDYESYFNNRTRALCIAYNGLASLEQLNPEKAKEYYQLGLDVIENYFEQFGTITSVVPAFNARMQGNRFVLYAKQGDIYSCLLHLYKDETVPDAMKFLSIRAVHSYEQAQLYGDIYLKDLISKVAKEDEEFFSEKLFELKFALFSKYITCFQFVSQNERGPLRKKANVLMKEFKENKHNFHEEAKKALKAFDTREEILLLSQTEGRSKKVEEKRGERYRALNTQLQAELDEIKKGVKLAKPPLKSHIIDMHRRLQALLSTNLHTLEELGQSVLQGLRNIEEEIYKNFPSQNIALNGERVPFDNLKNVYEIYDNFLGGENLIKFLPQIISQLVSENNLEEAVTRANILKYLEQKKKKNISALTRYLVAAIKNLLGDHEEWLAIEKEVDEIREKEAKKKSDRRLRQRQVRVAQVKLHLQEKDKEKDKEKEKEEEEDSTEPKQVAEELHLDLFNLQQSNKASKVEKQKRHEEAEKKREERLLKGDEESFEESPKFSVKAEKEDRTPDLPEKFSLSELYGLTGTAKDIDEKIEQNVWMFTREDLKLYYEAMGCDYKTGKGSHAKVAMPKATLVMQGEQLVSVINDFGGALTLPPWDKKAPYYLRTQILEARKKLAANKMKALQEKGRHIPAKD